MSHQRDSDTHHHGLEHRHQARFVVIVRVNRALDVSLGLGANWKHPLPALSLRRAWALVNLLAATCGWA